MLLPSEEPWLRVMHCLGTSLASKARASSLPVWAPRPSARWRLPLEKTNLAAARNHRPEAVIRIDTQTGQRERLSADLRGVPFGPIARGAPFCYPGAIRSCHVRRRYDRARKGLTHQPCRAAPPARRTSLMRYGGEPCHAAMVRQRGRAVIRWAYECRVRPFTHANYALSPRGFYTRAGTTGHFSWRFDRTNGVSPCLSALLLHHRLGIKSFIFIPGWWYVCINVLGCSHRPTPNA